MSVSACGDFGGYVAIHDRMARVAPYILTEWTAGWQLISDDSRVAVACG
ncbi:MAG: hypothetical protein KDA90_15125 [Planctomycetaceae bacterium]|nr:hypothetical protein [Planctomycetaceae bacterium]